MNLAGIETAPGRHPAGPRLAVGVGMAFDRRGPLGRDGEDAACAELARRGYEIVERRYRTRLGEIDIVARDRDTMVFVEVKTRSSGAFGTPAEAVTARKRVRVRRMATEYLWRHRLRDLSCRFEVAAVTVDEHRRPVTVDIVRDSFDA